MSGMVCVLSLIEKRNMQLQQGKAREECPVVKDHVVVISTPQNTFIRQLEIAINTPYSFMRL